MRIKIRSTHGQEAIFESLGATYFGDEGDLMVLIPKEGNEALRIGLKSLFGDKIKIDTESYVDRDFIFVKKHVDISVDIGYEMED